jgi:hypothetical protein
MPSKAPVLSAMGVTTTSVSGRNLPISSALLGGRVATPAAAVSFTIRSALLAPAGALACENPVNELTIRGLFAEALILRVHLPNSNPD